MIRKGAIKLRELFKNAKTVALIAHVSPDMDTLGSNLGAMFLLRQVGFLADVFCEDAVPEQYRFICGAGEVKKPDGAGEYDLALALDMPSFGRMGACASIYKSAKARFVIDHHITNDFPKEESLIDVESAAAAETVLLLVKELGLSLCKEAAMCLYAGLSTDTGNFSFSSVTPRTLEMAAFAARHGADPEYLTENLYRSRRLPHIRLLGQALSTMELHEGGRIALIALTLEDREKAGAEDGDYNGIVNYGIETKGVEVAAMLTQRPGGLRCSLRSGPNVDSSKIASFFGGGGHFRAAGMDMDGDSLKEAKQAVLEAMKGAL